MGTLEYSAYPKLSQVTSQINLAVDGTAKPHQQLPDKPAIAESNREPADQRGVTNLGEKKLQFQDGW